MPIHEPSNREILNAVTLLTKEVKGLSKQVTGNTAEIRGLKIGVRGLKTEMGELKTEIRDVRETVDFLKDNAVTRDEFTSGLETLERKTDKKFESVRTDLRTEIRETRNEMINHIDHFIQLHKKQEVEHLALVSRVSRHEESSHHA